MAGDEEGQIIVSKLRLMCDAIGSVTKDRILIYFDNEDPTIKDIYAESSEFNHTIGNWVYTKHKGYSIIGWIPVPIYKLKEN
tara:strand:- start:458 stop:703 length:246 start_codon:yes stop_codon:yes gene_type:complete